MNMKIVILAESDLCCRPFSGEKSLVGICIEKVKQLGVPVAVNSGNDAILAIAERMGVETQRRPEEMDDVDSFSELAMYLAEANQDAEYLLFANCTNPLISVDHFKTVLSIPPEKWKGFDSLNSTYLVHKHIWNGRTPLYNAESRPDMHDIKNLQALEYSINIISRENLVKNGDFIGKNPAFILIPNDEVMVIDEEIDFNVAQGIYIYRNAPAERKREMNIIKK